MIVNHLYPSVSGRCVMRIPYISLLAAGALALGGCAYDGYGMGAGSPYYGYGYGNGYDGNYGYNSAAYGYYDRYGYSPYGYSSYGYSPYGYGYSRGPSISIGIGGGTGYSRYGGWGGGYGYGGYWPK